MTRALEDARLALAEARAARRGADDALAAALDRIVEALDLPDLSVRDRLDLAKAAGDLHGKFVQREQAAEEALRAAVPDPPALQALWGQIDRHLGADKKPE